MLNGIVRSLSLAVGTSEAALRLLIALLLGYPIALIHRKYLYGKDAKHQYFYFIFTGFLLGYFNYGCDIFHAVFAIVFTYLTLLFLGGTVLCVAVVFTFNMFYLLTGYYYSGTNEYDINWTVPQCVLVLRLVATAYDLYDGHQSWETLSADCQKTALTTRPTFLEFCGHQMFPTCFLIGPQFSQRRFQDFIIGKFGNPNTPEKPPESVHYAIRRGALGIMYLIIFQAIGMYLDDAYMYSDEYGQEPLFKRLILLGIWGRYSLYKYISCWLLAEGGGILIGVSYNGVNERGETMWNGLENVKLVVLENSTEFNHYIQSFNVNTNHWVLQYIYKRLKFMNNKYISQAISLLFLAVWHGFHSGYYMCFLFEFLVIYLEKDLQSIIKRNETVSKVLKKNPLVALIINILLRLYTFVFMGWCLLPFVLLKFDKYWKAYGNVNYAGIFLYVVWPFVYGPLIRMVLVKKGHSSRPPAAEQSSQSSRVMLSETRKIALNEEPVVSLKEHDE